MTDFEPDYRNIEITARNERSPRLSVYEHLINPESMELILDAEFADLVNGDTADVDEFFWHYCGFYRQMTYDTVSFEVCVTEILPGGGALLGERDSYLWSLPLASRSWTRKYVWSASGTMIVCRSNRVRSRRSSNPGAA